MLKIVLGLQLIGYAAARLAGADRREADDVVNDFGRDPIGEGDDERVGGSLCLVDFMLTRVCVSGTTRT